MFGDRLDIVLNNYDTDYPLIKDLLETNSIPVVDHRLKPVSLENIFIKILKEQKV